MPPKKVLSFKHGAEANLARGTASHIPTKCPSPNSVVLSGLEDLDEDTLLSLSLDTPAQLTPPPGNAPLISESSGTPLSNMQVSTDMMQATLDQLGFGSPNDLSNIPISPLPTPTNSEISTTGTFGYEEEDPTAEESVSTSVEASANNMNAYASSQILRLFHQVAQRSGQSVNILILEWALCHVHTDLVKRRVAHGHQSTSMMAHQQAFQEEVNKVIELVGESFLFNFLGY
jgi:hypothetical protein